MTDETENDAARQAAVYDLATAMIEVLERSDPTPQIKDIYDAVEIVLIRVSYTIPSQALRPALEALRNNIIDRLFNFHRDTHERLMREKAELEQGQPEGRPH